MSATSMTMTRAARAANSVWRTRRTQLASVVRLELKKNFFRWRGLWVYLLAFGPTAIIAMHAIWEMTRGGFKSCNIEEDTTVMAGIVQLFYLRLGVFAGCMGICTRLFRGDMIERTLHYYFLAPVRREVLVLGKWVAGVTAAAVIFGMGVLVSFVLMFGHHGEAGRDFLLRSPGPAHLTAYLSATVLACLGYGAVFLLTGLLFRNPIIPAAVILGWESINHMLPAALQKLSVIHYVEPLCPIEIPMGDLAGLFAISANPTPVWIAVPGLLIFTAAVLAYACVRIRRVEIDYGGD